MKPFITIAEPHKDILEGKLTMDVFAADLWEVFKGKAPDEYKDPDIFFQKTFETSGLKNLTEIAQKRLNGEGGDPVIQLQTPFGGGKTHSLIALYHRAKEWKANVVVIDGTSFDPKERTIWEEIEEQLTGKVEKLKGKTSPGREKLREIFEKKQPLLILMDEILEYTTKSSGIKVGDSTLASQTLAFMQELTLTIKNLDKSLLVITLPSSVLEHYDENSEKLFQQIQKISGRMEKIYTPVQEEEISQIIRKRLFNKINEKEAKKTIEEFIEYLEKEGILTEEKVIYRDKFIKSFPFQPEVIEVLYKRWGSFPTFQRTRGVLRILALVVYSLKDSENPFIRLSDFDLKNSEIRRELIKHIGQEYDSIISADITSENSGSKKVDIGLGESYRPFSFGTKIATTIFMYSFSGGLEKGATYNEIKLSCAEPSIPSSIIIEALSKLKENLFYISDMGNFFTNQPNLNRILLTKMESIEQKDIEREEKENLQNSCSKEYFDIYIWPRDTKDIPDTKELKLIIMKSYLKNEFKKFVENCGEKPRIYRNTLIFLCPLESERMNFKDFIIKKLAWQNIENDRTLNLTKEQKEEVKKKIKSTENEMKLKIRTLYRIIIIPLKNDFKEIDLGIPTYGYDVPINKEIYDILRSEGEILEKLSSLTVKEKYLKDKDYVETKNILETFYKTPGEIRIIKDDVFMDSIKDGVRKGLFGLGKIERGKPICIYFEKECLPEIAEGEIIIKDNLCKFPEKVGFPSSGREVETIEKEEIKKVAPEIEGKPKPSKYKKIFLKLDVPSGYLSDIIKMINNSIKPKFEQVKIKFEILAEKGEIDISDYEDKIKETIQQINAKIEEEKFE